MGIWVWGSGDSIIGDGNAWYTPPYGDSIEDGIEVLDSFPPTTDRGGADIKKY